MSVRGPAVRFEGVGLNLGGTTVLDSVSFTVAPGEIHCLIGPNGGGKTSLVRALLGQMPHTGRIEIAWNGAATVGYVPQALDFDKTLPVTVADFMTMVLEKRRPAFFAQRKATRAATDAALERVGLAGKRGRRLGSLSGGERQRVLFAQALSPPPALLVLDEPMTAMDEIGAERFAALIRELASDGVTILWIAHDLAQVRAMASTVTCLDRVVLRHGAPQDVLANIDVAQLFAPSRAGLARAAS